MNKLLAVVLASVLLVVGAASVLLVSLDGEEGSSPQRTASEFLDAARHKNYGRACSYMTRKWARDLEACTQDEGKQVLGKENPNGSWTYVLDFGVGFPMTLTVVEQPSGKWRITKVA